MDHSRSVLQWPLVIGASLHWESIIYAGFNFADGQVPAGFGGFFEAAWVEMFTCFILTAVATAASRAFAREAVRNALAGTCIACGCIQAVVLCVPSAAAILSVPAACILLRILNGLCIGVLVLMWSHAFASLPKNSAGLNVAATALVSLALALALFAGSWWAGLNFEGIHAISRILSAATLLSGEIGFAYTRRTFSRHALPSMCGFAASRMLIGFSIGALLSLSWTCVPSPLLSFLEGALLVGLMTLVLCKKKHVFEMLPILPLTLLLLLALPFLGLSADAVLPLTPTLIWLSWIAVSSFQLSGLKEVYGLSETRLAFAEKALIQGSWTAGFVLGPSIQTEFWPGSSVAFIGGAAMLWATLAAFRTVYNRHEDELIQQAEADRGAFDTLVLDVICEHNALTKREAQVLSLIAKGYTRTYICRALNISEGTVRAHTSHIYQKLAVHKRDEILRLIEHTRSELKGIGETTCKPSRQVHS